MLINVEEIVKEYNCTMGAVRNRINRAKLKPVEKQPGKNKRRWIYLYDAEEVKKVFTVPQRQQELWKLSVFDFNLEHFIVKKVSLRKTEAKILLRELQALGEVARITPHIKR